MAFGDYVGGLNGGTAATANPFVLSTTTGGSRAVAVGDLIICASGHRTGSLPTAVTDNLGHTYTAQNAGSSFTDATCRMFYVVATASGTLTSVSITDASGAQPAQGCAAIFAGPFLVTASAIDANPANIADIATPYTANGATTTQASEVVIGWTFNSSSGTLADNWVAGGGFTIRQRILNNNNRIVTISSQTVSSTGTYTPSYTGTVGSGDGLGTASFKAGSSATAWDGQARGAGAGNLSQYANLNLQAQAELLDSFGTLNAYASLTSVTNQATFAGSGNLSVSVLDFKFGAATFAGIGNLSADSIKYKLGQSTFAGTGNLSARMVQVDQAAATFGGIGNLTASVTTQGLNAAARFSGIGNLSVDATQPAQAQQGSVTFAGTGNLSARANLILPAVANFGAIGNLSLTAVSVIGIAARFNGIGNLSVDGVQAGLQFGSVTLSGAGNLSAYALSATQAAIRFNAVGNLLSNPARYQFTAVIFAGNSSLSATYSIVKYGEVRLEGGSALSVSTISRQAATAIFGGEGFLRAQVTGGRTRRVPTNSSIAKLINEMRPDQTQDTRQDQKQTNRRLKVTHG